MTKSALELETAEGARAPTADEQRMIDALKSEDARFTQSTGDLAPEHQGEETNTSEEAPSEPRKQPKTKQKAKADRSDSPLEIEGLDREALLALQRSNMSEADIRSWAEREGGVARLSAMADSLRNAQKYADGKDGQISKRDAEIATLREELAELRGALGRNPQGTGDEAPATPQRATLPPEQREKIATLLGDDVANALETALQTRETPTSSDRADLESELQALRTEIDQNRGIWGETQLEISRSQLSKQFPELNDGKVWADIRNQFIQIAGIEGRYDGMSRVDAFDRALHDAMKLVLADLGGQQQLAAEQEEDARQERGQFDLASNAHPSKALEGRAADLAMGRAIVKKAFAGGTIPEEFRF
ncbi:MAG: hypothetical protein B7733_06395 [Myxococcales bacterium FL481]|nr:MAG: hypothetical protein B7733_06395 [Myxococcales bacterium FL481]